MRYFIKSFFLLFSTVVILVGAFYLLNVYLFDHYGAILPDETHTVVCGASISRNAIKDVRYDGLVNLSVAGRSTMDFFLTLKRIHRDYPEVRRYIVDFSYQGFSSYRDYYFYIPRIAPRSLEGIYPLAGYSELSTYPIHWTSYIKMLFRYKFTPNLDYIENAIYRAYPKADFGYKIPYIGAYEPRKGNELSDSLLNAGIRQYFYHKGEELPLPSHDGAWLDSLVNYTQKKDVQLILFVGPTHKSALARVPEKFRTAFERKRTALVENSHVHLLDLSDLAIPDSCFANHNHLNDYGAEFIVPRMKEELAGIPLH